MARLNNKLAREALVDACVAVALDPTSYKALHKRARAKVQLRLWQVRPRSAAAAPRFQGAGRGQRRGLQGRHIRATVVKGPGLASAVPANWASRASYTGV